MGAVAPSGAARSRYDAPIPVGKGAIPAPIGSPGKRERVKRILVFSFFPAFVPPTSGGEQRLYYLYKHLSQFHDVTLLSHTFPGGEQQHIEHHRHFREVRIPKDELFARLHMQLDSEGIGPECSALVSALAGSRGGTKFHEVADELTVQADCVIHESPYTLPFDSEFSSKRRTPRIYNSHNVESMLVRQVFRGPTAERYYALVEELEGALTRGSDLVFATCQDDADTLSKRFEVDKGRIRIAHNGFEPVWNDFTPTRVQPDGSRTTAVFLGSGNHPPNVEAARLIVSQIAPRTSGVCFHIAGSVCKQLDGIAVPSNVSLRGLLSEEQKRELLCSSEIGLNPVLTGGGTNLKMLDYLASGMAVITTPVGARGLVLDDGINTVVREIHEFPATLEEFSASRGRLNALQQSGREHVMRHFTWASAARAVCNGILQLLDPQVEHRHGGKPTKLLVLNDFPVSRGLGGGQVRIRDLHRALPEGYQVVLLCLYDEPREQVKRIDHRFVEVAVPKTAEHRIDQDNSVVNQVPITDIISGRHCLRNKRFVELVAEHARHADVIVFEHPYLAPLLSVLGDTKPIVYSSLNVEVTLKRALLARRADRETCLTDVARFEQAVAERAAVIIAVSESDTHYFRSKFPATTVVSICKWRQLQPNGSAAAILQV